MEVTVGSYNLNNLFSRFNFQGVIGAVADNDTEVNEAVLYEFGPQDTIKIREYMGRLVTGKDLEKSYKVAELVKEMDLDVLAVQEVEDIDTLKLFNRDYLQGKKYDHVALIEGNDPRRIDVGILSKYPLGGITSWQRAVHPDDPTKTVFGRDLLQIEVLNKTRSRRLFTIFNNHLKSKYVDFRNQGDPDAQKKNDARRTRQADIVAQIVKGQTRPDSPYIILGDMNDSPESTCLEPFVKDPELNLVDALAKAKETRAAPSQTPKPASKIWSHRFKETGKPALHELYDQIWLSPSLAPKMTEAWIQRRRTLTTGGSDHDPVWIKLEL